MASEASHITTYEVFGEIRAGGSSLARPRADLLVSKRNDEIWSTIDWEIGKRIWKMLKTEAEKQRNFQRRLHQHHGLSRQSTLYHFLRVYAYKYNTYRSVAHSAVTEDFWTPSVKIIKEHMENYKFFWACAKHSTKFWKTNILESPSKFKDTFYSQFWNTTKFRTPSVRNRAQIPTRF